jgi:hypothetical protein
LIGLVRRVDNLEPLFDVLHEICKIPILFESSQGKSKFTLRGLLINPIVVNLVQVNFSDLVLSERRLVLILFFRRLLAQKALEVLDV